MKISRLVLVSLALCLYVFGGKVMAVDIFVDINGGEGYDYMSIGEAIDAATNGDIIIVRPGRYCENINMSGKEIWLKSTAPSNLFIVQMTIIDGQANGSSVITCSTNETYTTGISGFTITNGTGRYGAGMFNENSSPTVLDCVFIDNTGEYGGGILNRDSSPTIRSCTFTSNHSGKAGGGIRNTGIASPEITYCRFNENTTEGTGGGVYNDSQTSVTLGDCYFANNLPNSVSGSYTDDGGNILDGGIFTVRYVDDDGPADFTSIQAAINASIDGDTIIVMPGRYRENIHLSGRVTTLRSSNPNNPAIVEATIIDGDTDANGTGDGTVIYCDKSEDLNTTISGFTVTNGKGTVDPYGSSSGGGIYFRFSSPKVTNCVFINNTASRGGGACIWDYSFPIITNCKFINNSAEGYPGSGGGIYKEMGAYPVVTNCTFSGNSAENGGGFFLYSGGYYQIYTIITNCTFTGNSAIEYGGGMCNQYSSSPRVTNCTFTGNIAGMDGGGIINTNNSSPAIINCIVADNLAVNGNQIHNATEINGYTVQPSVPTISYCNIEGSGGSNNWDTILGTDQGGNIDVNPNFVAPGYWNDNGTSGDLTDDIWVDGGVKLSSNSLCTDAGNNLLVQLDYIDIDNNGITNEWMPLDGYGNKRFFDNPSVVDSGVRGLFPYAGIVDMGAYEYQEAQITVGDFDRDGDVDMLDLLCLTNQWLLPTCSSCYSADLNGDGDVNFEDYAILAGSW